MRPCRPACRSGRLDHAYLGPTINHGRHVPPFVLCHLAEGRPVLPSCLGCWFWFLLPWCCTGAGFGRGGGAALRGLPRFNKQAWPKAIHLSGGGADRRLGEPRRGAPVADRYAAFQFLPALDLSTVLGAPILVFIYLKKAICSKLLVGAVDNPGKLGAARVCGLWKSRARDRLHVSPGQITRKRGTDYTLRISRIGRYPFGGGLSGRGTDYTWITLAIHKVCPQAGAIQRGGW